MINKCLIPPDVYRYNFSQTFWHSANCLSKWTREMLYGTGGVSWGWGGVGVIELSTLQTVMMRGIHLFWCQAGNLEAVRAFPAPTVALTGWEPQTHPSTRIPRHILVVRAAHTNHPINTSNTLPRLQGLGGTCLHTCCLWQLFSYMSLLSFF